MSNACFFVTNALQLDVKTGTLFFDESFECFNVVGLAFSPLMILHRASGEERKRNIRELKEAQCHKTRTISAEFRGNSCFKKT
jgi:hypothetical protein